MSDKYMSIVSHTSRLISTLIDKNKEDDNATIGFYGKRYNLFGRLFTVEVFPQFAKFGAHISLYEINDYQNEMRRRDSTFKVQKIYYTYISNDKTVHFLNYIDFCIWIYGMTTLNMKYCENTYELFIQDILIDLV